MDRKLRRELSKRKWISRAKKIYNSYKEFYVPIKGIKDYRTRFTFGSVRVCESITDFLNDSKYAKMLKNCTSPYRSKMMQYEYKKENRKDRYKAKKDIQEGIQEYESRDNLSGKNLENHLFIQNNTFIPVQSLAQVVKNSSYWLKRGGVPDERLELTQFNFESPTMRSIIMAELIFLANGKCDLKFHAHPKNFKRVEKFNYKKNFFKVYVDRNDSVYEITRCEVVTWKTIEKGKKKFNVPDEVKETRDAHLFDKIKGNPFKIAITKVAGEIDMQELLSE